MIDFFRSTFTWKGKPWQPDPHYRWKGGFVGEHGEYYYVRFNLESRCEILTPDGTNYECFLGSPCRSEYTIADRNLFQIPSNEWRMAFSHTAGLTIANRPSTEREEAAATPHSEAFQDHRIDIRRHSDARPLASAAEVVEATLANDILGCATAYEDRGYKVTVEYPVNLININAETPQFQVCTGPILLPDLDTWNGSEMERVFVADAAITSYDWVEFILRREIDAAPEEREWLDRPRGRDRLELTDPENPPSDYPPSRPKPLVFNETWEMPAANTIVQV